MNTIPATNNTWAIVPAWLEPDDPGPATNELDVVPVVAWRIDDDGLTPILVRQGVALPEPGAYVVAGDTTLADVAAAGRRIMRWRLHRLADVGIRLVDGEWQAPEGWEGDPYVVRQVALVEEAMASNASGMSARLRRLVGDDRQSRAASVGS